MMKRVENRLIYTPLSSIDDMRHVGTVDKYMKNTELNFWSSKFNFIIYSRELKD